MNTAPLYPKAWQIWVIAFTGQPTATNERLQHLSTQTRAERWLARVSRSEAPKVELLDALPPGAQTVRRREQMDVIPTLPAGEQVFSVPVRWYYSGSDAAVIWPADREAMLLSVHEPDRSPAPEIKPWWGGGGVVSDTLNQVALLAILFFMMKGRNT